MTMDKLDELFTAYGQSDIMLAIGIFMGLAGMYLIWKGR